LGSFITSFTIILCAMPLPLAGAGRRLAITGIDGGCNLRRRLTEMGL
jgi:hypothetical protein